jgi:tight adherence protein B
VDGKEGPAPAGHLGRDGVTMELKVKALSSEAKSSAWIIGSLPIVLSGLIYLTSPGYLEPLWTTEKGQMALSGVAIWMSVGILFMRQMVNFKP